MRLVRHRQTKETVTDRIHLRDTAPVLDPTLSGWFAIGSPAMARPLRIEYDGALYHVTSRGNDRKAIFKDDSDRELFLNTLARVTERFHWICHGYCLMNNHYHLVIETPDGNLSKGMRQLNGVYTQAFNKRHRRVGHIFQGRFKGILVLKDSHFLEVCRYTAYGVRSLDLTNRFLIGSLAMARPFTNRVRRHHLSRHLPRK